MIPQIFRNALIFFLCAAAALADPDLPEENPREGGLTGTGIFGEITALGSIIVNGQRIALGPDLTVLNEIGNKSAAALVPGDVVAVAVTLDDGTWAAQTIRDIHPVIGPVASVGDNQLSVLGITIMAPDGTALPSAGDWVAVSGFWARDVIVATRIQNIAAQDMVSIKGSYSLGPDGTTSMIGSVDLVGEPLQHAREGDVIRIRGRLADGVLTVTDIHRGLFDEPVSVVLAEGYLSDVAPSGHYTVAGSGLSSYTDDLQSIMAQERITVCGIDGQFGPSLDVVDQGLFTQLGCPSNAP